MAYTIAFFGTKPYDEASFNDKNKEFGFEFRYYKGHLNKNNVLLTQGVDAVCIFVNDTADAEVINAMAANGVKLLATALEDVDMNGLRDLGDQLKEKLGEGVVVLASANEGKVSLIAMATEGAMKQGAHAGNLIKAIAAKVGGGGGGRPNMAQAGGKNPAGIPDAIAAAKEALAGQIK